MYTWNPSDPCFGWKRPCFDGFTGLPSKTEVIWALGMYIFSPPSIDRDDDE